MLTSPSAEVPLPAGLRRVAMAQDAGGGGVGRADRAGVCVANCDFRKSAGRRALARACLALPSLPPTSCTMAAVSMSSVDGANLVVTEKMQAQEAAFMQQLAASAEGGASGGATGASADDAAPGAASLTDAAANPSERERVLELMLAQAAKFSEFVNQSLARAGAAAGGAGPAADGGAAVGDAAAGGEPAKKTTGAKRGRASGAGGNKRRTKVQTRVSVVVAWTAAADVVRVRHVVVHVVVCQAVKQSVDESAPATAAKGSGACTGPATGALKQPALLTGGTLRPYQMEGYTWLSKLCVVGWRGRERRARVQSQSLALH